MKTLILMRHAKSSWKNEGLRDYDRPLNKRGKGDAPRMGRLLDDQGLRPELILCSSAKRAKKTYEMVVKELEFDGRVEFLNELYHALPENILYQAAQHGGKADRVMIVGHNPGLEELIEMVTGESIFFPTASVCEIRFAIDNWRDMNLDTGGTLVSLWRPKELDGYIYVDEGDVDESLGAPLGSAVAPSPTNPV